MSFASRAAVPLLAVAAIAGGRLAGGEVDVAPLLGTADGSSADGGAAAARAIDGDTDGDLAGGSVSGTAPGDPAPWWRVDLGGVVPIARIVLWNRTDCCPWRLTDFRVSVLDPAGVEVRGVDCFPDGSFPAAPDFEVPIGGPVEGRVVRIDRRGPDRDGEKYLALAEVQVFADTASMPVTVLRPPRGATLFAGRSGVLSVGLLDATGVDFRWRADGREVPGGTGPSLTLCAVTADAAGAYSVRMTRGAETVDTDAVAVKVVDGDLALYGKARQSTVGAGGEAGRAIDGDIDGAFDGGSVTLTADGDPAPWWEVVLPSPSTIAKVILWGRTDACCADRLSNFRVSVLDAAGAVAYSGDFFAGGLGYPDTSAAGFEVVPPDPVPGRTVRIEIRGPRAGGDPRVWLSLAEVAVIGVPSGPLPDVGLARGKPAEQSSTGPGHPAGRAVDGDRAGWSATGAGGPAWWQVDLCGPADIGTIVLYNRLDGRRSRLRDITVSILDAPDGRTVWNSDLLNQENKLGGGGLDTGPSAIVVEVAREAGGSVRGGAVRVARSPDDDLSGTGGQGDDEDRRSLSLAEVEVFAEIDCTRSGDTHCRGLTVEGPPGGGPGDYRIGAEARDDSGDDVLYTFRLDDGIHPGIVIGPTEESAADVRLAWGDWTVSVSVADGERCLEAAPDATCSQQVSTVLDRDNVAPFGRAAQSSTDAGAAADRAIDGIADGVLDHGSVARTADGDPSPWWQVDLGKTCAIDRIVLWGRTDCCPEALSNFEVVLLDAAGGVVGGGSFFTDLTYPDPGEGYEIPVGGAEGRTVRIALLGPNSTGGEVLALAEVEVYRVPIEPPDPPRNLAATAGKTDIVLRWDAPDGGGAVQGYAVVRDGRTIAELPATVRTYRDAGLETGKRLCYAVIARGDGADSLPSSEVCATPGAAPVFRRGDSDGNGAIELTDAISTLSFMFLGGAWPPCPDAADADDNGAIELTDAIFTLSFMFLGGERPPAPGPSDCGPDPAGRHEPFPQPCVPGPDACR